MRPIGKSRWKGCCWSRAGNAGADCGAEGVEQKRTAVSGRWRALTSNWREVTSYDSRFYLDISVGFIFLSETAAAPFVQSDDRPNSIARLFQLPVLQGRLLRDAKTEAEHCCRPLHLQKLQHDGAPVVGHPIQFYELDGTARLTATATSQLGEQVGTRLCELHIGAAFVHPQPNALDR
jgi:hypothetical protein